MEDAVLHGCIPVIIMDQVCENYGCLAGYCLTLCCYCHSAPDATACCPPLQVHAVFESILDIDSFSVRLQERSLPHLPKILLALSPEQVSRMQRRLAQVRGGSSSSGSSSGP